MRSKPSWWLGAILALGAVLRLVWLERYPAGFTPDEAAFGYNAYSLVHTGKDEWGTPWWRLPFTNLRSFGDYKLPLYAFLAVPSVKIFGLTEFATRLPNAILGVAAIAAVYLLANQLFPSQKLGGIAAALLAISPWHISLSRGAFEANLLTFFFPLAIYLYLRGFWQWSALVLAVNFYSYHSARILTPLIVAVLLVFPPARRVNRFLFGGLILLLCLPAVWSITGPGKARLADVGIFSPTDNWQAVASRRFTARNRGLPDPLARVFSNKAVYIASLFSKNYLSYLSPEFLFTRGAGEATYGLIPGRGVLYYGQLPLLILFLVGMLKKPSPAQRLLLLLLLVSLVPAALTKGPGYAANRASPMIAFLAIMSAAGFELLKKHAKVMAVVTGAALIVNFAFFVEDYLYQSPGLVAASMTYGWGELVPRLLPLAERFPQLRVSRSLSEPHIFVAFYSQTPPALYQEATASWTVFSSLGYKFLDQYDGYYLGKFRFGNIYPTDPVDSPVLYVGKPADFPPDFPEYFHIDYPNGQPAIKVAERKP